jgi:hypothetical protein
MPTPRILRATPKRTADIASFLRSAHHHRSLASRAHRRRVLARVCFYLTKPQLGLGTSTIPQKRIESLTINQLHISTRRELPCILGESPRRHYIPAGAPSAAMTPYSSRTTETPTCCARHCSHCTKNRETIDVPADHHRSHVAEIAGWLGVSEAGPRVRWSVSATRERHHPERGTRRAPPAPGSRRASVGQPPFARCRRSGRARPSLCRVARAPLPKRHP